MRVELIVVMVAIGGCDNLFGLTTIDPLADAPTIDGTRTDAHDGSIISGDASSADLGCVTPFIVDHFTSVAPCSPWGRAYMASNGLISEGSHSLVIAPSAQQDSNAGCISNASILWTGGVVIVRARQILTGTGPYTMLRTHDFDDASIAAINGNLRFQRGDGTLVWGTATYQSAAMQWWRLRTAGGMIFAEYSSDGAAWNELGHQTWTAAAITVELTASSSSSSSPQGVAEFTDLYVCSQ